MFKPSRNPAKVKVICSAWDFAAKSAHWLQVPRVRDTLGQIWMELFREGCWLVLSGRACAAVRVWEYTGLRYLGPWTLADTDQSSHIPGGLQFGRGRRWSRGRNKETAEQEIFPWFWQQHSLKCSTFLEMRIRAILIISILEFKAPSKAHWGGEQAAQCAWGWAHSACCSPDLLESSHSQGTPSKEQTKLRLLPLEIRFQDN